MGYNNLNWPFKFNNEGVHNYHIFAIWEPSKVVKVSNKIYKIVLLQNIYFSGKKYFNVYNNPPESRSLSDIIYCKFIISSSKMLCIDVRHFSSSSIAYFVSFFCCRRKHSNRVWSTLYSKNHQHCNNYQ